MTLSISDQPSQWHRITKRHSLLSDATIDPFPHRTHRTASLIDHHIVRDDSRDVQLTDDGRRNTAPYLPHPPSHLPPPIGPHEPYPYPESRYPGSGPHTDLFHDSRKRSVQEMAGPEISEESSSPTSPGHVEGGNQFCLCQPEPKIPRPRNAFILYRQHQQAAVVRANPGLPNPAISKIIGEQWSRLPEAQKNEWKALAEEEKARHAQQYPDYRYQPRRNGRYSSQSSGSGPPSGGQVDDQGNCKKCGGKTMNPPTTPYNPYPTTPRASTSAMPRGSQSMVSPPQSGRPSYGDRHWPPGPPRFDPRDPRSHDPRARYPSMPDGLPDAPDVKRRRFDGNGIYIPTREWREAPYQYSPRGGNYFRGEIPPDAHRPSVGGPPRPSYAQPATGHAPRLSLARPPPPIQQKRDPSLTLPPLTTPITTQPPSASSTSALEAMIMTISVINKIKILAQISPHLPPLNGISSASQEVRGSVVAIEGMDPTTVFSMTNSLAEELERDGKFAVRIFSGPDPYALRGVDGSVSKRLSIAETLGVIGEWHKISEEMKRFISTRVSPTAESGLPSSTRTKSVAIAGVPSTFDSSSEQKTPDDQSATADGPMMSKPEEETDEQTTTSVLSPSTVAKTADIKLATPPSRRPEFDNRTPTGSGFPNSIRKSSEDDAPYTRVPAAAIQARPTTPPRSTRSSASSDKPKQFDTAPPPRSNSTASQHATPTPLNATAPASALPTTPTTPTSTSNALPRPSVHNLPPSPGLSTGTPIPIALVPHYQLTTVDSAAITLPINDSYSPLAHWQWLATLWRGCVGPDVTIVIQGPGKGGSSDGAAIGDAAPEKVGSSADAPGSVKEVTSAAEQGKDANAGAASATAAEQMQPGRQGSAGHANPPGSGNSEKAPLPPSAGPEPHGRGSASAGGAAGGDKQQQGVDVRLLECRAVVVRMNGFGGVGVKDAGTGGSVGSVEERQNAQFWETAKRRVGFEVGEFLRR